MFRLRIFFSSLHICLLLMNIYCIHNSMVQSHHSVRLRKRKATKFMIWFVVFFLEIVAIPAIVIYTRSHIMVHTVGGLKMQFLRNVSRDEHWKHVAVPLTLELGNFRHFLSLSLSLSLPLRLRHYLHIVSRSKNSREKFTINQIKENKLLSK